MIQNVFRFGDSYWIQLSGTAMGAPPAPMYATLYFAKIENQFIPKYPNLFYYRRYIDDGFGIWNITAEENAVQNEKRWNDFKNNFNSVSTLEWTFSDRTRTTDFLDINVTLTDDGRVRTRIFEKALNLHLYLPPHSCHPPGVLKGIIHGMMLRFHRLSTTSAMAQNDVKQFLKRLVLRGYSPIV